MSNFKILELNNGASKEEIKAAFRRLAKIYHPDIPGGNEAKFKEISQAYSELMNGPQNSIIDPFSDEGSPTIIKNVFQQFIHNKMRQAQMRERREQQLRK